VNVPELKRLIAKGESDHLECKRSTGQRTEAAKTVCAMLNGLGGFVIFGVTDKGDLVGQEVTDSTLRDVVQELKRIEPAAFPKVTTVKLDKKRSVIVITVEAGGDVFTYDGRPYVRQGSVTSVMPRIQYDRLILENCIRPSDGKTSPPSAG